MPTAWYVVENTKYGRYTSLEDMAGITGTRRAQKACCASVTMVDRDSTIRERGEVEKPISLGHRKDTECTMEGCSQILLCITVLLRAKTIPRRGPVPALP